MNLNQIRDNEGALKRRKRVGRGMSSGKGKTSGRGVKGFKARSGASVKWFEGGQMPLHMRLPKRGFNSLNKVTYELINLGMLQKLIDDKKIVDQNDISKKVLEEAGLIRKVSLKVKILAKGTLKSKIVLEADHISKTAQKIIEGLGGAVKLTKEVAPSQ